MGGLGPKNAKNMATLRMCLFLERERDLWPRGQSGAALGACLGGLGPLLEPMLAVLGPMWSVLEEIRAEKWPWLGQEGELSSDQGGKVARTRAGARFSEARIAGIAGLAGLDRSALKPSLDFFNRYVHAVFHEESESEDAAKF